MTARSALRVTDTISSKLALDVSLDNVAMENYLDLWASRDEGTRYVFPHKPFGSTSIPWSGSDIAQDFRRTLAVTENFFVGKDVMRAVSLAASAMPPEVLHRDDMPSENGFLLFEEPWSVDLAEVGRYGSMPIRGLLWSTRSVGKEEPARMGVVVWALIDIRQSNLASFWRYADTPVALESLTKAGLTLIPGTVFSSAFGCYSLEMVRQRQGWIIASDDPSIELSQVDRYTWRFTSTSVDEEVRPEPLLGFLQALWTFQRQEIAPIERLHLRKTMARMLVRRMMIPNPVSVIHLRRRAPGSDTGSSYALSHRFIVRGHWRRQFYSSEQRHRSIWINPHVKGPDGAPWLVRDRVNAVVR